MLKPRSVAHKIILKTPPVKKLMSLKGSLQKSLEEKDRILNDTRLTLSHKFIRGHGIEIGALHMPLPLPKNAKARYVDYIPVSKLRQQYPELKDLPLVKVDIVDNGERLTKVKDCTLSFIIANHLLEHCQDPIGTILNFYKKLKPGGVMYLAVPDKRYTFDMRRPLTKYSHLLEELKIYPSKKYYKEHAREIVKLTEGITTKAANEARVLELTEVNYSIHYHVWSQKEMVDFFYTTAQKFKLGIEIQAMVNNVHEVIFIVQKLNPKTELAKVRAIKKHYFERTVDRTK